ncbi:hypothetical protein WMF39_06990 [Sorangium sp. So ce1504]|uniref:hypothetical protein n=1 Tax=Sorangium sp. So ce1504 TaxID=3133337 RepID=UPI003F62DDF1
MRSWEQQVQAVAATLGLDAQGGEAKGLVAGRPVSVELSDSEDRPHVLVHGSLRPPLDLGLEMARRQTTLGFVNAVLTGSDDLDSEFSIAADDPSRTGDLFTVALREHLVALHRASYELRVHDGGCTLSERYGSTDEAWIVRAAHSAAQTVELLDDARAGLRAAASLAAHAEALRALASARGLAFASVPLSITGRIEGGPIEVGSARAARGRHRITARASFETELGLGLAVRRERLLDGLVTRLGGQDIVVEDEAFDRRFHVRVDPRQTDRAPALLDPGARVALLALDERAGPVTIDDRGVTVGPIAPSIAPDTMVWAIDTLDEVRARIERNLLRGPGGGPYR